VAHHAGELRDALLCGWPDRAQEHYVSLCREIYHDAAARTLAPARTAIGNAVADLAPARRHQPFHFLGKPHATAHDAAIAFARHVESAMRTALDLGGVERGELTIRLFPADQLLAVFQGRGIMTKGGKPGPHWRDFWVRFRDAIGAVEVDDLLVGLRQEALTAAAAQRAGSGSGQDGDDAVDPESLAILRALAERPKELHLVYQLEVAARISRRTISERLPRLEIRGLVARPSPRKGATITSKGITLLESIDRAQFAR
jgi:hypothetical protein